MTDHGEAWRRWAAYWADLANIENADDVDEATLESFAERLARLRAMTVAPECEIGDPHPDLPLGSALGLDAKHLPPISMQPPEFVAMQRESVRQRLGVARRCVRWLLDGDRRATRPFPVPLADSFLRITPDGRVEEYARAGRSDYWDLHWLHEATRPGRVFPIRKCLRCEKAFARHARQVYCGPSCRRAAFDATRIGTEPRKAQVAKAQQKLRLKAKKAKDSAATRRKG